MQLHLKSHVLSFMDLFREKQIFISIGNNFWNLQNICQSFIVSVDVHSALQFIDLSNGNIGKVMQDLQI